MTRTSPATVDVQVDRLRRAGLRVTTPRVAILTALAGHRGHPTAEQIHASLRRRQPSLSLSTVYQTLDAFIRAGLIRRVPGAPGRLRVDGTEDSHDHAICGECGGIFDVDRRHVPLPAQPLRLPQGLEVRGLRLEYDVLCRACSTKSNVKRANR